MCRSGRAMSAACTARPSTGDTIARSSGCSTPAPPRFRMAPPQYCENAVSFAQRGAYLAGTNSGFSVWSLRRTWQAHAVSGLLERCHCVTKRPVAAPSVAGTRCKACAFLAPSGHQAAETPHRLLALQAWWARTHGESLSVQCTGLGGCT